MPALNTVATSDAYHSSEGTSPKSFVGSAASNFNALTISAANSARVTDRSGANSVSVIPFIIPSAAKAVISFFAQWFSISSNLLSSGTALGLTDGSGDMLGSGETTGLTVGFGVALGKYGGFILSPGLNVGVLVGEVLGEALGELLGSVDGLTLGETDGVALGDGDGLGTPSCLSITIESMRKSVVVPYEKFKKRRGRHNV